ncbi:MAG TPA: SPFH domain-containing protein [Candidatus Cybelea sp.]|jgi:membrane protease subunit HflK|nr:SPFH domain-containing protein [Candidatus Cybelea sp.]
MDQNTKKTGLLNCIALLGASVGMLLVSRYVSSSAATMGAVLTGYGLLVSLLSYFHIGLLEREQFEKMEMEELSKSRGSESLFATAGSDTFPARRSREQFERFFIPTCTAFLFLLQVAGAYWPWQKVAEMRPIIASHAGLAMSLLGLMGMILFLLGKYSSGLARLQKLKLLRPSSAYMLLSAYANLAVIAAIAAVLEGIPKVDFIVARVLCVVSGLAAVETLLALVLEGYRVRIQGRETRLLYESRLVGLLGQPEAIITTAAHALDYQFGFKVSDTWFYRFLEKALGWLVLAQFGVLVVSSCFFIVEPGDQALVECFGKPMGVNGVVGPGLHIKPPWPIGWTTNYHTERIQTFLVGAEPEKTETIAWAVGHAKEQDFLVASRESVPVAAAAQAPAAKPPPVSMLAVSIPVHYQITNLATWAYTNEDPVTLLTNIAERAVVQYLASADFDDLMSSGRGAAENALRQTIQDQANVLNLGAHILFVGLEDIHPPTGDKRQKVAEKFEEVIGAAETREAKILTAQGNAISNINHATGESFRLVNTAEADKHGKITNAIATATLFANQELAYSAAPGFQGVYEQQAWLAALVENSADARKYVIATTNVPNITLYNLEDKVREDLGIIENFSSPTNK